MDASSAFQDSLPVSSDALLEKLDRWGIAYALHTHVPLRTVEDAKQVQDGLDPDGVRVFHTKNFYLRDRKKRNYLVTLEQDRNVDLAVLGAAMGAGKPSFGSAGRLMEFLGVRPGAVSPLAMENGTKSGVRFFLDPEVRQAELVFVHPLVNDRTIALTPDALLDVLNRLGVDVEWLELGDLA